MYTTTSGLLDDSRSRTLYDRGLSFYVSMIPSCNTVLHLSVRNTINVISGNCCQKLSTHAEFSNAVRNILILCSRSNIWRKNMYGAQSTHIIIFNTTSGYTLMSAIAFEHFLFFRALMHKASHYRLRRRCAIYKRWQLTMCCHLRSPDAMPLLT